MVNQIMSIINNVCYGCLDTNSHLLLVNSPQLKQCFYLICNEIKESNTELLQILLCYYCIATLRKVKRFQEKVQNAQRLLQRHKEDIQHQLAIRKMVSMIILKRTHSETKLQLREVILMLYILSLNIKNKSQSTRMIQDTSASNIDTHSFVDDDDGGDDEVSMKDEDDIPLVLLKSYNDTKSNSSSYKVYKKRRRHKEQLANRFTSRMVRETNEYIKNGPFQCEMCSQYCPSAVSLRGHIKSHTTRFQCSECPERFLSKTTLSTHQVSAHDKPRPAQCGLCSRAYSSTEALRLHTRRSHRPVPREPRPSLPCPVCDKAFTRKNVLKIHMRVHTGERPYVCQCGAAFTQLASLRAHHAAKHRK
ncbi:unnamed protein product [Leptidea sinapis]|uniref:C2H2-type domain-containing protein n=1 Tax=Leptidea sinapis TaxID=189913 RepID=A0A5E4QPV4_9NEOP|nr:unnamed protein product [Leptidea sinapis]